MQRNGVLQPLALATVLAGGFVTVWGLLGLWAVEIGQHVAGVRPNRDHLQFLADGTPVVSEAVGRYGDLRLRGLDGEPVAPEQQDMVSMSPLAAGAAGPADGVAPWSERVRAFSDGRLPAVFWYFVSDGRADGSAYLVGYDSRTRTCVGYLGAAGYSSDEPPAGGRIPFDGRTPEPRARVACTQVVYSPTSHPEERLGGRAPRGSASTWDVYVHGRDRRLYHADLQARTLQVILDEPHLRSMALAYGPPDSVKGTPRRPAVRTDDAVRVLDDRGQELHRYPIPAPLRDKDLSFGETVTGAAVMYWNSPMDTLATEAEYRIYHVTRDGQFREALLTLPRDGATRGYQMLGAVVVPSPLVLGSIVGLTRPDELLSLGRAATRLEALDRALQEYWPALASAQIVAFALAVLCRRRQVRYRASRAEQLIWPLFVLVLGLPGWVGYRFGRSWPMLEPCPDCTTVVPRDREHCAHCATDFPRPALKGTEVFA